MRRLPQNTQKNSVLEVRFLGRRISPVFFFLYLVSFYGLIFNLTRWNEYSVEKNISERLGEVGSRNTISLELELLENTKDEKYRLQETILEKDQLQPALLEPGRQKRTLLKSNEDKLTEIAKEKDRPHETALHFIKEPGSTPISNTGSKIHFSERIWLLIGINTVSRTREGKQIDYLSPTLESLLSNLPLSPSDPLWGRIKIVLCNVDPPKKYSAFDQNRNKFKGNIHFDFVELPTNRKPDGNDAGNGNVPGYRVRQQTRDVVSVMRYAESTYKYDHYMFMEDDMELCENGFTAIHYLLNRAALYHDSWLGIRASIGLNGIFLLQKDVTPLADYFEKHQKRRPPDHLIVEWYAGETEEASAYKGNRVNIGFRFNIFNHLGIKSTLRGDIVRVGSTIVRTFRSHYKGKAVTSKEARTFPNCWTELEEPSVFKVEAWNRQDCPEDDIWPCTPTANLNSSFPFRVKWV